MKKMSPVPDIHPSVERQLQFPSLIAAAKYAELVGVGENVKPKQVKTLHPQTGELVVRWVLQ